MLQVVAASERVAELRRTAPSQLEALFTAQLSQAAQGLHAGDQPAAAAELAELAAATPLQPAPAALSQAAQASTQQMAGLR